MFVVLNSNGFYVSTLYGITGLDKTRPDVVEAPDQQGLTDLWQLVDGVWVEPSPLPAIEVPDGHQFASVPVQIYEDPMV